MRLPHFKKEWFLYGLAGMGLSFATVTIAQSQPELERVAPRGPMNIAPYRSTIAATAIVEPASQAIRILPEIDGRVQDVLVVAGSNVAQGDILYRLDDRLLKTSEQEALAALAKAEAEVSRREAKIVSARTKQNGARVAAAQAVKTVNRYRPLLPDAISPDEFDLYKDAAEKAIFSARSTGDNLISAKLDKDAALQGIKLAQANLATAQVHLSRATIRSPINGQVLSVNIRPGDVVNFSQPTRAVTVGSLQSLHLRAEIDEAELPKFNQKFSAVAFIRGIEHTPLKLEFLSLDPILKKKSDYLSTEVQRLDSRVLEVVYRIEEKTNLPLYVGQLVDVYISKDTPIEILEQSGSIKFGKNKENITNTIHQSNQKGYTDVQYTVSKKVVSMPENAPSTSTRLRD